MRYTTKKLSVKHMKGIIRYPKVIHVHHFLDLSRAEPEMHTSPEIGESRQRLTVVAKCK